ncbi:MAG: hypothetical protein JWN43_346 [Gammaproteobacteria bacterium]|nr:hypothetical protein [Gammaproteobacteria bacterium]
MRDQPSYRIGVDIGGTFTDLALYDDTAHTVTTHKLLTTPDDPARAVVEGTAWLCSANGIAPSEITTIVHGTTLVTNAVIERRGAVTAMLVTKGFRDVLDIARERRYDLYDLRLRFPEPAVPRHLRFEVEERLRYDGQVATPLDLHSLRATLADAVAAHRIEAVAVCLLHSYVDDRHERAIAAFLSENFPALKVSLSASVLPSIREYERWTTTCLNAYVQPVVDRYLAHIEAGLRGIGFAGLLLVMPSSGTTLTPDIARRLPIRLLESGPAAGALMSARHGRSLGLQQILSFDMGGTTAKGCIISDGRPLKRYEMEVARVHEFRPGSGLPVRIPVIDMIEIGAGGGSLAEPDERGAIRVGPRSAGAHPGPACYGAGGTRATLTDANLLLGYLGAGSFLGGAMRLDVAAARGAIDRTLAAPLGMDVQRCAWGIHEVVNEDVARAFRVHASECGIDYRRCSMVVFGGSGPLHGTRIARKLRIPRVICPAGAGVMSAFGLLSSPIGFDVVRSRRASLASLDRDELGTILAALRTEAGAQIMRAGVAQQDVAFSLRLDARYEGQGYEVEIALPEAMAEIGTETIASAFHQEYQRVFGTSFPDRPVEIVSWKIEAFGPEPGGGHDYALRRLGGEAARPRGERAAWNPQSQRMEAWPVFDRYTLEVGASIAGPALIEERESTCVLGPQDRLEVDRHLNMIIEIGE